MAVPREAGQGRPWTAAPGATLEPQRGRTGRWRLNSGRKPLGMNSSVIYSRPVNYSRSFTVRIARFLLVALLLQVMGISFAHSRDSTGGYWSEICSVGGAKWVKSFASDGGKATAQHASSDHCVFCNATTPLDSFDLTKHLLHQSTGTPQFGVSDVRAFIFAGHRIRSRAPPSI